MIDLIEHDFQLEVRIKDEYLRLDAIVRDQLLLNIEEDIFNVVSKLQSARKVWNKIVALIQGTGINKSTKLTARLQTVLEKTTNNLSDYAADMQNVIRDFSSAYPMIPEEYWMGVFVGFIPAKYNYLRSSLARDLSFTLMAAFENVQNEHQFIQQRMSSRPISNNHLNVAAKKDFKHTDKVEKSNVPGQSNNQSKESN